MFKVNQSYGRLLSVALSIHLHLQNIYTAVLPPTSYTARKLGMMEIGIYHEVAYLFTYLYIYAYLVYAPHISFV